MSWFKSLHTKRKGKTPEQPVRHPTSSAPPAWQPAPEQVHALGLHSDAPDEEYEAGEAFCQRYPPEAPRLLPSEDVERIRQSGCGAWRLVLPTEDPARAGCVKLHNGGEPGKMGTILVESSEDCRDICILSDLPLLAGLYDTRGKRGVYYEIKVLRMEGVIAIGALPVSLFTYIIHSNFVYRYCVPPLSALATTGMEPPQRWAPPRRRPQVLRRPGRRANLPTRRDSSCPRRYRWGGLRVGGWHVVFHAQRRALT